MPVRTTNAGRRRSVVGRGQLAQVRLEHRLDLRRAGAPVEPRDGPPILDEDEGGNDVHPEPLGELGAGVDVDSAHAEAIALLPLEMGEQALHAPGGTRALGPEEHEQRPIVVHRCSSSKAVERVGCCISRKRAVETQAVSTLTGDG